MDEYEKMMAKQGDYNLVSFNKNSNFTGTTGFFNTRGTGVSPRNVSTQSRLMNINVKNTKDQEKKKNPFVYQSMHEHNNKANNILEPVQGRGIKSCNDTSELSYLNRIFHPNSELNNPQNTVHYQNYRGGNTRFDSR